MADPAVDEARQAVRRGGPDALVIDDLHRDDLGRIGWSGSPTHIRAVAKELDRVDAAEAEYLVLRAPSGMPVAKGLIDYTKSPDAGTVEQLATHPALQSRGLGTRLITEAEQRIRKRGRRWCRLAVEKNNPRARALYEQLGYSAYRSEPASWDAENERGEVFVYKTEVVLLRKELNP